MEKIEAKTEIDKILGLLTFALHPEYFKQDYIKELNIGKSFNKKRSQYYFSQLSSIKWFIDKISRYSLFFCEFYPDSKKIEHHVALEHHIHAYLEDIATIKNKLGEYLGALKNDLKTFASNKEEVEKALKFLIEQIHNNLSNALGVRRRHRHGEFRFVDKYVTEAEAASMAMNSVFKEFLSEEGFKIMQSKFDESISNGKKYWTENAEKNSKQISGLSNDVVKRTIGFLVQFLGLPDVIDQMYN